MAVGGGFGVNRVAQFQPLLDSVGTHIEDFLNFPGNFSVRHIDFGRAFSVDKKAARLGYADSVGNLHQYLVAESGGDHVLGDVARSVSRRAVHFGRVFARERATTVGSLAAVGVHDNLAARQARVTVRPADDEFSGRVDVIGNIASEQFLHFCGQLLFYPWDYKRNNI